MRNSNQLLSEKVANQVAVENECLEALNSGVYTVNVMFYMDKGISGWTNKARLVRSLVRKYTIGTVDVSPSPMVYRNGNNRQ